MTFWRAFDIRRSVLIVATLLLAFICGHAMQTGFIEQMAVSDDRFDAGPALSGRVPALPTPPAATLTPTPLLPPQITRSDNLIDGTFTRDLGQDFDVDAFGVPCAPSLSVLPAPMAMIRVTLLAPCHSGMAVTLQHEYLTVSVTPDRYGRVTLELPALSSRGTVRAIFGDDAVLTETAHIPDTGRVRRAALVWTGPQALTLEADEPGDLSVDRQQPFGPTRALRGEGGYLTRLDSPGGSAEIYTFPTDAVRTGGRVRLRLRTLGCDGTAVATRLEPDAFGAIMAREVTVVLPACGTNAVVENAGFRDIQIARR